MMNRVAIYSFLFFVLLGAQALAGKSKPLLPVDQVQGSHPSVNDAIKRVYLSFPYDSPDGAVGDLFVPDQDLIQVQAQAILDFIKRPGTNKEIYLVVYGLGAKPVTDAVEKAKKAGIKVTIVTDLNRSLVGNFPNDEKITFDFDSATAAHQHGSTKPTMSYRALRRLQKAGFKFWKRGGGGIFSQGLYRRVAGRMTPILHEKALLLKSDTEQVVYFGTANLTQGQRYNRLYQVEDPHFFQYYLDHTLRMMDTFAAGKEIKHIDSLNRLRIGYRDGSSFELGFTDGKYNLNERITNYLNALVESTTNELVEGVMMHFVMTYIPGMDALEAALKKFVKAELTVVAADRFAETDGWGVVSAMGGFSTFRPFGNSYYAWARDLTKRIHAFICQRAARDGQGRIIPELSEDAAPTGRHLVHDKTSLFFAKIDGAKRALISTGSFNYSNNHNNDEFAVLIDCAAQDPIAVGTAGSIKGLPAKEPEYHFPVEVATARNDIARIVGRTDLELLRAGKNFAERMIQAIEEKDYDEVIAILRQAAKVKSKLTPALPEHTIWRRITRFERFLQWYRKQPQVRSDWLRVRQLLSLSNILGNPTYGRKKRWEVMHRAMWKPRISQQDQFTRTKNALTAIRDKDLTNHPQIISWHFDWDDNIIFMKTTIILFHKKKKGKTLELSTAEYALYKEHIGGEDMIGEEPNPYSEYEFRPGPKGSLRNFRGETFRDEIKELIRTGEIEDRLGPSFWPMVQALVTPEGAQWATVNTSRGHPPEELWGAMWDIRKWLLEKFNIPIYVPPVDNFRLASYILDQRGSRNPTTALAATLEIAEIKLESLVEFFNRIQANEPTEGVPEIVSRDGKGKERLHTAGFSDDDPVFAETIALRLADRVKEGQFSNIKIFIFYKGEEEKTPFIFRKSRTLIITPDGSLRAPRKAEQGELKRLLEDRGELVKTDCVGQLINDGLSYRAQRRAG